MKKNISEAEFVRLREELKQVKKENKSLAKKLEASNCKKSKLASALKKKDVQRIKLNEEQLQSLLSLLKDTDTLNSLLD